MGADGQPVDPAPRRGWYRLEGPLQRIDRYGISVTCAACGWYDTRLVLAGYRYAGGTEAPLAALCADRLECLRHARDTLAMVEAMLDV